MDLEPGARLGVYEIESLLGKGGMGEVYAALDPRLRRRVAIKLLPTELAASADSRERFRREAESLAALNHPSIVTVFSIEEDAGTHFLTMELVEGRGLDALVEAEGGLPSDLFFDVAVPLADAVAAAHARGIVHRDLKPANLMLTADGRLKVLDFGLAKLAPATAAVRDETLPMVTALGHLVGTAQYMSPEQARGEAVDERSDVFSLGTVLWELATGRCPFQGDSLPLILYAIVTHDPTPPIAQARPDLPDGLQSLLLRCLVKKAAERRLKAAQARDELAALGRAAIAAPPRADASEEAQATAAIGPQGSSNVAVAAPTGAPALSSAGESPRDGAPAEGSSSSRDRGNWRRPVIAVLPFRSPSADPEIEDFATELWSDTVDGVASTSQAVVLPGSATEPYRRERVDTRRVGRELEAGYVLQGSVRRGGDRLRVSVQLVSVEDGTQIWSRRYDRDLSEIDLFDAGDDIGAKIVSAVSDVHGVIFENERQRAQGRPVAELDPWECIFLTLGYDKFADAEHHRQAREALEHALELDPGFALAWGYLSWVVHDEEIYGFNPRPDSARRAAEAARRAIELDPYSHMLRWLRSRVLFFSGDIEGFLAESAKSLELNSSDATTLGLIGMYTALAGRWPEGRELLERAVELNPSYPSYYHWIFALDCFRRGELEEALEETRHVTFSDSPAFEGVAVAALGHLGRQREAVAGYGRLAKQLSEPVPEALRGTWERWNLRGELLESLLAGVVKAASETR